MSEGSEAAASTKTMTRPAAIAHSEPLKPRTARSRPPRKKPAPFSAFLDPVRMATHLNSEDEASSGRSTLMELLELIFVRSFATPLSACVPITYATDTPTVHRELAAE